MIQPVSLSRQGGRRYPQSRSIAVDATWLPAYTLSVSTPGSICYTPGRTDQTENTFLRTDLAETALGRTDLSDNPVLRTSAEDANMGRVEIDESPRKSIPFCRDN